MVETPQQRRVLRVKRRTTIEHLATQPTLKSGQILEKAILDRLGGHLEVERRVGLENQPLRFGGRHVVGALHCLDLPLDVGLDLGVAHGRGVGAELDEPHVVDGPRRNKTVQRGQYWNVERGVGRGVLVGDGLVQPYVPRQTGPVPVRVDVLREDGVLLGSQIPSVKIRELWFDCEQNLIAL